MKKSILLILAIIIIFVYLGCEETHKIEKISIIGETKVFVNESISLSIVFEPDEIQNEDIIWESNDKTIATVCNGTVTGHKVGSVIIEAISEENRAIKDEIIIIVEEKIILEKYIVKFENTTYEEVLVESGTKLEKPNDPVKEGYIFIGWFIDSNFTKEYDFNNLVTNDLILYPKFEKENKEYNVKFENTMYEEAIVKLGEKLEKPNDPIKEGYIFIGWFVDCNYTKEYDFNNLVTNDLILYPKFEKENKEFKIKFENTTYEEAIVKLGEKLEKPNDPEKEGYIFIGWFVDCNYTKEYDFNDLVTSDLILYALFSEIPSPISIELSCDDSITVGFSRKINVKVYPENTSQKVIWEIHWTSKELANIDDDGLVTALKSGVLRVRAVSLLDSNIKSSYIEIKILSHDHCYYKDLKGYEFTIMVSDEELDEVDPFLNEYNNIDKIYKQMAIDEIRRMYNCSIIFESSSNLLNVNDNNKYTKLIENSRNNTINFDIAYVSTSWMDYLAKEKVIYDVTSEYDWQFLKMHSYIEESATYNNLIYGMNFDIGLPKVHFTNGLVYDTNWVKELGVESPAKMFNEGKWNYTGFTNWVLDVQAKLDENEYVLGGQPYNYWLQMTNSSGEIIANKKTGEINLFSSSSKIVSELINKIVINEAFNTDISNDINLNESAYNNENSRTLMIASSIDFNKMNLSKYTSWKKSIWNSDEIEVGFVPYPYQDDIKKEDIKISNNLNNVYVFLKGKSYPSEFGIDEYKITIRMISDLIFYTYSFYEDNAYSTKDKYIENMIKTYVKDEETIKAILSYNETNVIYDPAHSIYYGGTYINKICPLYSATEKVIINGYDYDYEFNNALEVYKNDFNNLYSLS